jgi:PKD repeat protein
MNRYRSLFKIPLVLAASLALSALLSGSAAANTDPFLDVNFHSFTLDSSNSTCIPYDDGDVGPTRNCDPVNLIFPDRTWQQVRDLLLADDWSTSGGGSSQWLHYNGPELYVENEQLYKPGTLFGPRYHIRLWQAPGETLVTFAAVHHEDFLHNINLDWEQAEAAVASALCDPNCQQAYLPTQVTIQGEDGEWRSWGNNGSATVIPAPGTPNQPPTASFSFTCADLSCDFDASVSSDPDGTIAGYAWDFGDSNLGTGAMPNHVYAAAGTYHAVLIVTDNEGATGTDEQDITVSNANYLPLVIFDVTCAGPSCDFDASASSDPDGTIVDYAWDFGDSNSSSGSSATTNHSYAGAGTFDVTLALTDNDGGMATDSQQVTVASSPASTMHVGDLAGLSIVKKNWRAEITITVHDEGEGSVSGAKVSGDWSGDTSGNSSCTTDGSGTCTVSTLELPKKTTQTVVFTVTDVAHDALAYEPAGNHDPQGDSSGTAIQVDRNGGSQDPGATPGQLSLSAVGYKVKGVQHVDLTWGGAGSDYVDIYRDGDIIITYPATETGYTDNLGLKRGGPYAYQVCEAGSTAVCSAVVAVEF